MAYAGSTRYFYGLSVGSTWPFYGLIVNVGRLFITESGSAKYFAESAVVAGRVGEVTFIPHSAARVRSTGLLHFADGKGSTQHVFHAFQTLQTVGFNMSSAF
jgi:hypothetical protein